MHNIQNNRLNVYKNVIFTENSLTKSVERGILILIKREGFKKKAGECEGKGGN